ncbi:MAG: amidohydrolase [Planctomycetales bacterium]|nr:amidohydrolase [Planctomycetales bacterium]
MPNLLSTYRHLHAHPEVSFDEGQTAVYLTERLQSLGAEVATDVGGHGFVAMLRNGEGPTLMIRSDLDALPVTEQTDLPYASQVTHTDESGRDVGVMHACGHDVHMTNLLGAADFLASHRERWQGTVMFVGQPAEERGAGAKAMLEDGLFERFARPDMAIALHVDAQMEAGKVGVRGGFMLANVDSVDIEMKGKGGHGAYPQTTVDPVVEAAYLVVDLQSIVAREIAPTAPAVVTVGSIHGGTKHNVISDGCHLQLTVRSYSDEVRQQLLEAIVRKAKAVAESFRAAEPEISISEGTPAMYNNPELAARLGKLFRQLLGDDHVVEVEPSMGGEDFARYGLAGVPITMFRLGSIDAERLAGYARFEQSPPSLHSPRYYPDPEPTLTTGLRATIAAVEELLPPRE